MEKEDLKISKAAITDVDALFRISHKTFLESFAKFNTEEDMRLYMDSHINPQKLAAEMSNPDSEFYLAEKDNKVIGYLKVNFGAAQNDLNDERSLEIERIYISNEFYGKGYGQVLFDKAVTIAKSHNLDYIWLGVWEKNEKAINFYIRNGMSKFSQHSFMLGNDRQTDILMKLELQ